MKKEEVLTITTVKLGLDMEEIELLEEMGNYLRLKVSDLIEEMTDDDKSTENERLAELVETYSNANDLVNKILYVTKNQVQIDGICDKEFIWNMSEKGRHIEDLTAYEMCDVYKEEVLSFCKDKGIYTSQLLTGTNEAEYYLKQIKALILERMLCL